MTGRKYTMASSGYGMSKTINVIDQTVLVLLDLKTKDLDKALAAQALALQGLAESLREYSDWLQEQIVRLDGER